MINDAQSTITEAASYTDIIPKLSLHKNFIEGHNEYCSPGSYVVLKNNHLGAVGRILYVCDQNFGANGRQESSIPEDLNQVMKINIFEFANNMSPQPRPL